MTHRPLSAAAPPAWPGGASLVLDAVDEPHPPVSRAATELEQWLRTGVQANLYASWTAREGFGVTRTTTT